MGTMSHITLQRVIVRMLYDQAFARLVTTEPDAALVGLNLDARHISFLTTPDPRVWRLDPHRRARSLEALLDEYPVSAALLAHTTNMVSALDAFFSSDDFHQCIQHRQRLALAFGRYLTSVATKLGRQDIEGCAQLEFEIASFRRRLRPKLSPETELHLGSNVALAALPGGTLDAYAYVNGVLQTNNLAGAAAIIAPAISIEQQPTQEATVVVLLEGLTDGQGPGLSVLDDALANLLVHVSQGSSIQSFGHIARTNGAEHGEEADILKDLIEDGLIARSSA